jgi:hypothetical protein
MTAHTCWSRRGTTRRLDKVRVDHSKQALHHFHEAHEIFVALESGQMLSRCHVSIRLRWYNISDPYPSHSRIWCPEWPMLITHRDIQELCVPVLVSDSTLVAPGANLFELTSGLVGFLRRRNRQRLGKVTKHACGVSGTTVMWLAHFILSLASYRCTSKL